MDPELLAAWFAKRKKKQDEEGKKKVNLPNGLVINIHLPQGQQQSQVLPLTPDGKAVATRDAIARFPS